jgi:hypothetical protein
MALRVGLFYCASSLAGAFGGLLARGLSAIGPRGGLQGWRWILIIEGLIVFTLIKLLLANILTWSADGGLRPGGIPLSS